MVNSFSIFNERGEVLRDIDPAEVEKLSLEDQEVLQAVLTDCSAAEQQDQLVAETRKSVHAAMVKHDEAQALDAKSNPAISPTEAARQVIVANNPHMDRIEPRKPNKKVRAALAAAVADLASVRSDYTRQLAQQKITNATRADAILKWMKTQQVPTFDSLARAAAKNWVPNPTTTIAPTCEMERQGSAAKLRQRRMFSNQQSLPGSGRAQIRDIYKA